MKNTTKALSITDEAQQQFAKLTQITKTDFYSVGGKKLEPSARALQVFGNKQNISTKILETYSDNEKVSVRVLGWIGGEVAKITTSEVIFAKNPDQVKEDSIEINYDVKARQWILKQLKFGKLKQEDIEFTESGKPIPKSERARTQMADFLYQLRDFGIRSAITKAEARIHKKLLSLDFYEEGEKELETEEFESVQSSKNGNNHVDAATSEVLICSGCKKSISPKVKQWSIRTYNRPLCMPCQEKEGSKPLQQETLLDDNDIPLPPEFEQ